MRSIRHPGPRDPPRWGELRRGGGPRPVLPNEASGGSRGFGRERASRGALGAHFEVPGAQRAQQRLCVSAADHELVVDLELLELGTVTQRLDLVRLQALIRDFQLPDLQSPIVRRDGEVNGGWLTPGWSAWGAGGRSRAHGPPTCGLHAGRGAITIQGRSRRVPRTLSAASAHRMRVRIPTRSGMGATARESLIAA